MKIFQNPLEQSDFFFQVIEVIRLLFLKKKSVFFQEVKGK
jgi:hypothetical protein